MKIASGIDWCRVLEGEILEGVRQVLHFRHGCAVDQQRDHRDVGLHRGLDLDADEIGLLLDAGRASRSSRPNSGPPPPATDRFCNIAFWMCSRKSVPNGM